MEHPPVSDGPTPGTYHRARKRLAALAVVAGVAWACVFRWRPQRVIVEGASMAPTLLPGDWCLAVTPRAYRRGDVVVVEHPERPGYEMVKRMRAMPGETVDGRVLGANEYWVEGDLLSASTDSRQFGPVSAESLKAKILLVYGPGDRRRLVR